MAVHKIYVGNLSFTTDEAQLREMFSAYGEVEDVAIAREQQTDRSRGFGFVFMSDETAAKNAIMRVNRQRVDGRRIIVVAADKKRKKAPATQQASTTGKSSRPLRGRGARRGGRGNIRVYRSSDDKKGLPF